MPKVHGAAAFAGIAVLAALGVTAPGAAAVSLDGRPVRYVQLTMTAATDSWWSVADVRAYVTG